MPTDTLRESAAEVLKRRAAGGESLRRSAAEVLERRRQPVEPADEIAGNAVTDPFERAITDRWADHELGHLDPSAAVQVEPSPKEPESRRRDVMRGLSAAMRDIERIRGQKTDRGAVQELVSRFSRGMYVGPLEGASGLFEMAGDVIQSEMLRDIGSAAELGSAAAGAAVPASDPSTRTTVGRFAGDVAEAAPQFAGQIGASIVGQFAGIPAPLTFAATAVGPVVGSRYKEAKQFYLEQGRPDGEASMLASSEAMTDGLITYAVNQVGGKFLFNTPMGQQAQGAIKRLAGRIATGFVVEGGTEGAEKVLGDFTSGLQRAASEGDIGLLESMLTLQYWKDVGWEFGIGGVLGAGGGGAVHGTQVPRDTKEASDGVQVEEAAEVEATEEVATETAAEAVESEAMPADEGAGRSESQPQPQERPSGFEVRPQLADDAIKQRVVIQPKRKEWEKTGPKRDITRVEPLPREKWPAHVKIADTLIGERSWPSNFAATAGSNYIQAPTGAIIRVSDHPPRGYTGQEADVFVGFDHDGDFSVRVRGGEPIKVEAPHSTNALRVLDEVLPNVEPRAIEINPHFQKQTAPILQESDSAEADHSTRRQGADASVSERGPEPTAHDAHQRTTPAAEGKKDRRKRIKQRVEEIEDPPPPTGPSDLPTPETASTTKWYHGSTTSGLDASSFSSTFTRIEGLFGSGVYLTDSPRVAAGYANPSRRRGDPTVYEVEVSPRNIVNMEKTLPSDVASIIERSVYEQFRPVVREAVDEGKTGAELWESMTEAIVIESHQDGVPVSEYYDMFQAIESNLREAGYDALTHIGGTRAGRGRKLHRVLIMLDPDADYSPGTYDRGTIRSAQDILESHSQQTDTAEGKQPWEMTREEYDRSRASSRQIELVIDNAFRESHPDAEAAITEGGSVIVRAPDSSPGSVTHELMHADIFRQFSEELGVDRAAFAIEPGSEPHNRLKKTIKKLAGIRFFTPKATARRRLGDQSADYVFNTPGEIERLALQAWIQSDAAKDAIRKSNPGIALLFDRIDTTDLVPHHSIVESAIERGESVPPEVLADYPDLQAQRESTDTEAVTVTEGEVGEAGVARPEGGPRRTGMVLVENVSNPAKAILKRNLTAAGDLPKRVFEQKIKGDGWINSHLFQTRSTLRDFDRAVKESYGTKKLSKEQKKKIDDVLKGDADPNTLPEPVRDAVAKMRMEVDAMSQKMIDLGVVEGKTAATVSENMGVYLTRSYRVFDDPKWADKVPRDVRNKAKALLRSEYPNRTDEEIDALIKNLLYEGKAAESPIALIRQAKLGSKDLSILTRRKGIAPEIRALWGEYRDPKQNYARSMAKMAHLVGNHQFLSTVRDEGLGVWFHEKPTTKDGVDYITRIAADESDVMRPLNGLYTSPEIKTAFEEAFASTQHGMAFQLYMRANATVKYSKTIGSVQTHIRNVLGNTGFAVANGHWRIAKAGNAWKTTLASLGGMSKTKWRDYYRELLELGVVNESPRANELHDVIRDASNRDVDDWMETNALNVPRRVVKGAQAVYRAEDDVWKVYAYENELARYRKAWRGRPEQEIKERAAYIVRNTYPTYSLVPKAIKYLRRTPVVGTFVSFPWEVGRTAFHTVSIAAQELANPETRAIGAQRAAGALAAASLTPAIGIASRMILGMTSDDDEDMRRFLPPWSKNSNLVYIGRGENGKPLIVDLSYTDPHEYLKTPIIALMRGDNWQEAVFDSVKEATEPFFGEEILFGRVVDTLRNTTSTGGRIWNEQDTALQKTKDIVQHIGESLVPGTATSMNRIWKGLTGYVTPYGRGYDAKTEALATFTGHRVMEVDVPQSLSFAARRSSGELRDATSLFSTVAGRSGTVTPEEIEDAWNRMDSARRRIFEDASKDAQAAVRQGMKERDVLNTLNEAGWSKDNSRAILRGTYVPYKMSPAMKQRIIRGSEKLGGLTGENARTLMRERLEAISRARTSQERTSP